MQELIGVDIRSRQPDFVLADQCPLINWKTATLLALYSLSAASAGGSGPERAWLGRSSADPDLEGGNALLSDWTTPAGLPFRASCNARTGMFWLGWMQQ